jgi:hypothetical protein
MKRQASVCWNLEWKLDNIPAEFSLALSRIPVAAHYTENLL